MRDRVGDLRPEAPCSYCVSGTGAERAADDWSPDRLAHLYLCCGLSTYRIAELVGMDRQRVARALHRAGVAMPSRGVGRLRPLRRQNDPPGLPQRIAELYQVSKLSSRQIAEVIDVPERTVRDWLRRYGIQARSRGFWNREDRQMVSAGVLHELYQDLGMTAAEVAETIGASRNTVLRSAHDLGLAVRTGGPAPLAGPGEIELVRALYDDELVVSILRMHNVPRVPAGQPIWARFPVPVPLSAPLVESLYWCGGISLHHIELLTGQPAMTIRGFMHRAGIPLRHPGGRTPFLRRWRTASTNINRAGLSAAQELSPQVSSANSSSTGIGSSRRRGRQRLPR